MALNGRRPVVVLSRDVVIPRHRRALIAPCTTTIRHLPSEVLLEPGEDPVPLRSAVNLDSVESVSIAILWNASAGWPMTGCGRSAALWPSQSTAQTERRRGQPSGDGHDRNPPSSLKCVIAPQSTAGRPVLGTYQKWAVGGRRLSLGLGLSACPPAGS